VCKVSSIPCPPSSGPSVSGNLGGRPCLVPTLVTLPLVPGPWPSRPMEDVSPHPRRLVARREAGGCGGRDGGHAWCGGAGEGGHIGFAPWGEPPLDVGGAVGL